MGQIDERLKALAIELPQPSRPGANYAQFARSGNQLFLSSTLPDLPACLVLDVRLPAAAQKDSVPAPSAMRASSSSRRLCWTSEGAFMVGVSLPKFQTKPRSGVLL